MSDSKQPRVSAGLVRSRLDGGFVFGVVAKRTYHVSKGRCEPAAEQLALREEPLIDDEVGRLLQESDLIITRDVVDLVLLGSARVNKPQPSFVATFGAGPFRREIQVTGPRRAALGLHGRVLFSQPEPISEMPLTWANAYGGVDTVGLEEIGDPFAKISAEGGSPMRPNQTLFAYPRNPFGKGYVIEGAARALEACELPNLEYPRHRVEPELLVRGHFVNWPLAPVPAATEWLGYNMFPRSVQLGLSAPLYDEGTIKPEHFHELSAKLLSAESLDPSTPVIKRLSPRTASQAAAPGMRVSQIDANQAFELGNVHPEHATWSWSLPNESPRMAYRLSGRAPSELAPKIRAVVIEPDESRVQVVWVGEQALDVPVTSKELEQLEHGVTWR